MTAVTVRSLAADEWRTWRDLRLRAMADSPDSFGGTLADDLARADAEWVVMMERGAAAPCAANLVAFVGDEPAGMGYVGVDDNRIGHVFAMWVVPEYRRRGAGAALIRRMVGLAARCRARYLELRVTIGNEAAERLYAGAGFVRTGRVESLRPGSEVTVAVLRRHL